MGAIIRRLSDLSPDSTIVVTDVGQHQMKAARYYRFNQPGCFVTSGGLGTMGFGLPAAIGAKIGYPDRQVIAIIGDGGFQMTMQEIMTAIQEKAAVKILLINNGFLGMVRQWQELFFSKRYASTELFNPDFSKVAEAMGMSAHRIDHPSQVDAGIEWLLSRPDACLLEVMVAPGENVFPMVPPGTPVSEMLLTYTQT
jgi:acetolactate synthase-1/2/3 large subunit